MYIIDFDGTLFDTYQFAQERIKALIDLGVSKELYQQTYQEARNGIKGFVSYSDKRHAQLLALEGFDEQKVFNCLKLVSDECKNLLFAETIGFLKNLKQKKEKMILLSLGDPEFQEMKIKNTGIHDYFDRVFMVNDTKEHILKEILAKVEDKEIWFINDKPQETLDLVKMFPQLIPVMKVSKFFKIEDYQKTGLPYFESLEDLEKYMIEHKFPQFPK